MVHTLFPKTRATVELFYSLFSPPLTNDISLVMSGGDHLVTCVKDPLPSCSIEAFQETVMTWWKENARDLPWRREPDPYHVLVSEFMLQQTQVSRVVPKYLEFLSEFPTLESLAEADTKRLLGVWSGLGYNRRALWLRESAKHIVESGEFPGDIGKLRALKGIGPYTSKSILIFAFNRDLAAVDTNIRRILVAEGFATEYMTDKELQAVADALLLRGRSRDWHNALMDYGSLVLTSASTGISPRTQQGCFTGSTRELRGAVLRALMESGPLTADAIISSIDMTDSQEECFDLVMLGLMKDCFLELTEEGTYTISD
jgi:A/G-specific adenine glycosylase